MTMCEVTRTTCYTCHTQIHVVLVEHRNATLNTIDYTITYYILWGFTSSSKLRYNEDIHIYLRLKEPCHDLEFLLTPVWYKK